VPWEQSDEIIEEFEFDLELAAHFFTHREACGRAMHPATLITLPCFYHCIQANNVDYVYSTWVAVSRENIYIIRKRRKTGLRCYCCDQGEVQKVIPIANVQDVMVTGPAGTAVCCFVPNVLHTVEVQTAAAGGQTGGDANGRKKKNQGAIGTVMGLADPKRFRDTVMRLKRELLSGEPAPAATAPQPQVMMQDVTQTQVEMLEVMNRLAAKLAQ